MEAGSCQHSHETVARVAPACVSPQARLALVSPHFTKAIVERVPPLSKAAREITKNLGVDYTHRPRKGLARPVRKHWLKVSTQRALRIQKLRKAGGNVRRLVAASVKPASLCGTHGIDAYTRCP